MDKLSRRGLFAFLSGAIASPYVAKAAPVRAVATLSDLRDERGRCKYELAVIDGHGMHHVLQYGQRATFRYIKQEGRWLAL